MAALSLSLRGNQGGGALMPEKTIDWLKENSPQLSVGVISANIMRLEDDIQTLEKNNVNMLHFDVMDGHFAPPLTIGPAFVKAVKTTLLKDVHLMIANPLEKIQEYVSAGADKYGYRACGILFTCASGHSADARHEKRQRCQSRHCAGNRA